MEIIFAKNFKEILDLNKQAFNNYVDQMLPNFDPHCTGRAFDLKIPFL